jgi:Ca2+/Na+ antiporter
MLCLMIGITDLVYFANFINEYFGIDANLIVLEQLTSE